MPTNPTQPNTNASVDRLTLGINAARGTEPANLPFPPFCFDVEASNITYGGTCFEAEASGIPGGCFACSCFETE